MGHWLSQGVRIYEHTVHGKLISRRNFNYYQGMGLIEAMRCVHNLSIVGIGSEGGAMSVHYRWLR